MSDARPNRPNELPKRIAAEADRERSLAQGSLPAIHRWWARRPVILARVATYLAITGEQAPAPEFLAALGAVNPPASVVSEACVRVRDAAWQWTLQETLRQSTAEVGEPIPPVPETPRVLDPFAGGGSIPLEASRLGCAAYAGDLNPIAYLLLRTVLEFPAAFLASDPAVCGSGSDGTWAGLVEELQHWARRVEEQVSPRIAKLFPVVPEDGRYAPNRYFWFNSVRCSAPGCGAVYPMQEAVALTGRPTTQVLAFSWSPHQARPVLTVEKVPEQSRGTLTCPACGAEQMLSELTPESFHPALLGAVRRGGPGGEAFLAVAPEAALDFAPWLPEHQNRLEALLGMPFARSLRTPLPYLTYQALHRYGCTTFQDLFSQRQLLVALEYVSDIRETIEAMRQMGLPAERVEALSTYLAFFVGYLVDRNSKLCRWNHQRGDSATTFDRPVPAFARVYVERSPVGLLDEWLAKVVPAIQTVASVPQAARVYAGDASCLPFEDDSFDAVVTDPPYYDRILYNELADFFWVWESIIVSAPESGLGSPAAAGVAYIESKGPGGTEVYRQQMLRAFEEIYRVLKPGRKLCLFFTGHATQSFQEYVDLCQQAGFEFIDVRSLPEAVRFLAKHRQQATSLIYLIYLWKPMSTPVRERLKTAEASSLLNAAAAGKSVLYAALAELIAKELSDEDVTELLLPGGKGDTVEQLMEVIAEDDPRAIIERCFGLAGVRQIARDLNSDPEGTPVHSPVEFILSHFGFSLPALSKQVDGAAQVCQRLRVLGGKIAKAVDKSSLFSPFLEGCATVERLLRVAIWGWAQLLFGPDRDTHLLNILQSADPNNRYTLDRLSFGQIITLFRNLPDHIASSPHVALIERKFGRRHIYVANDKKRKFADRLGEVVEFRNKVEHNKSGYRDDTSLPQLREDLAGVLHRAVQLLGELSDARAIPRVAEPFQEIRDKWSRMTYRLNLDDGTDVEVCFSGTLALGGSYLYFGTETNPRPVDPLVLRIDELGTIP